MMEAFSNHFHWKYQLSLSQFWLRLLVRKVRIVISAAIQVRQGRAGAVWMFERLGSQEAPVQEFTSSDDRLSHESHYRVSHKMCHYLLEYLSHL